MFTGLVQATGLVRQIRPMANGSLVRLVVQPESWDYRPEVGDSVCVSGVCLTVAGAAAQGAPPDWWPFDVVPETLSRTTLGGLGLASRVNLERSVTAATLMGGHFVQGHIDGVAEVVAVRSGPDWRVVIRPPAALFPYLTPKGSVCIDGVSLTIAELFPSGQAAPGQTPGHAPTPGATPAPEASDGPARGGRDHAAGDGAAEGGGGGAVGSGGEGGSGSSGSGAGGAGGGAFSVALIPTTLAKTTLGALKPGARVNIECDVLTKAVVHTLRTSLPTILAGWNSSAQAGAPRQG